MYVYTYVVWHQHTQACTCYARACFHACIYVCSMCALRPCFVAVDNVATLRGAQMFAMPGCAWHIKHSPLPLYVECVHACACVHAYPHASTCISISMHAFVHACTPIYMYMFVCIYIYIYVSVIMYT